MNPPFPILRLLILGCITQTYAKSADFTVGTSVWNSGARGDIGKFMSQSGGINFNVGKVSNGFRYSRTQLTSQGQPVYRCVRGSDLNDRPQVYWLFRDGDGRWNAFEAARNTSNPRTGTAQFRTVDPIEDITTDKEWVQWHQWDEEQQDWAWPQWHQVNRCT